MDEGSAIRTRPLTPALAGAHVLAALTGAALALVSGWFLAPRLLDGFEAATGDLAWLAVGLAGGAVGLAVAAALGLARDPAGADLRATAPAGELDHGAWLHVVTGGRGERIARATCELAARSLARGRRVVVVDASRRLRLHEALGLSAHLGFVECMTQGQPSLGLLQSGGFTGLFLLARGRSGRLTDWLPLDRVLEELRPHFDRVILVFEKDTPAVVGGVLAGRVVSGWWAGPQPAGSRAAENASASLAIPLFDMDLSALPHASLEAVEARLRVLIPAAPEGEAGFSSASAPADRFRVSPPAILDCDLQVRQKLRFLAWMRRMRTERERTPAREGGPAPPAPRARSLETSPQDTRIER